jgi:hypothetical protein
MLFCRKCYTTSNDCEKVNSRVISTHFKNCLYTVVAHINIAVAMAQLVEPLHTILLDDGSNLARGLNYLLSIYGTPILKINK